MSAHGRLGTPSKPGLRAPYAHARLLSVISCQTCVRMLFYGGCGEQPLSGT